MKTPYLILIFLFGFIYESNAQQLVYTPVNPNFGGNYLNYSWLLSSANAQNQFDDRNNSLEQGSLLDNFSDSLKRQILSRFSRELLNEDGEPIESGTIEVGGFIITIDDTRTGSVITIIDSDTGESTEIII